MTSKLKAESLMIPLAYRHENPTLKMDLLNPTVDFVAALECT